MRVLLVSAFATKPFRGNPAAVCFLDRRRSDATMQAVATELNQPVTAFVRQRKHAWDIRWFTPETEIDLCGHATLAAAFAIWQQNSHAKRSPLAFRAAGEQLMASPASKQRIQLDFPARFGRVERAGENLIAAAGLPPITTTRYGDRWIFEYSSADDVRKLRPDFDRLRDTGVRALIVTARSDVPEFDIVSRNFPPLVGINEDHATGTAHTCLATYWLERLGDSLCCWQASPRGGSMMTKLIGDRVFLEGSAIIEMTGRWLSR